MNNSNFQSLLDLGRQHHHAGQIPQADQLYRQALLLQPNDAEALYLVGIVAVTLKNHAESLNLLQRAAAINPDAAHIRHALGVALITAGKPVEAEPHLRKALKIAPSNPVYHYDLGVALKAQRRYDEAIESYERTVSLMPHNAFALSNIGTIRVQQGRYDDAIIAYETAVAHQPTSPLLLSNLANTLYAARRYDDAMDVSQKLATVAPNFIETRFTMSEILRETGRVEEALAMHEQFNADELHEYAFRQRLGHIHYHPARSSEQIFAANKEWGDRFMRVLPAQIPPRIIDPTPNRRLRVGYISPDFHTHVVGYNILPLFMHHDRNAFEIFLYPLNPRTDDRTTAIKACADHWTPLYEMSHDQAADIVRSHNIDILVDLALHTKGNSIGIFARKPAPIQFNFAGYPGTTGLAAVDYRITDHYLDPPEAPFPSTEKPLYISSFWCYEAMRSDVPIGPPPVTLNDHFTFGSLNASCKINQFALGLWASTLAAVPNSRMVILFPTGRSRDRILKFFADAGIDASRIDFTTRQPRCDYLAEFNRIDLCLDTLPYNGHTTSLDGLWMGVPTLTMVGQTIVGRAGLSQLSNLNLPEFITTTRDEYIAAATQFAANPEPLAILRKSLRARMESSVLMDGPRFAKEIEATYRTAWQSHLNSTNSPRGAGENSQG